MENQEMSLNEVLELIKKRWRLIVLIVLLASCITGVVTIFFVKPVYETRTKIFIGKENGEEAYSNSDISMYQQLISTFSETIKTRDIAKRVIENNSLDIAPEEIAKNLSVYPINNTQLLQIIFKSNNKDEAVKILSGISDEFVKIASELVPNSNCKVIEAVESPKKPISPNLMKNVVLAILLGLFLGVGISFVLAYLDNTYKNKLELENDLNIPTIGSIPLDN